MTTYYKATFSDGTVVKRSTASRTYTYAWLMRIAYHPDNVAEFGPHYDRHGFSRDERTARNALWAHERAILREVAPVIEITRQEYKS